MGKERLSIDRVYDFDRGFFAVRGVVTALDKDFAYVRVLQISREYSELIRYQSGDVLALPWAYWNWEYCGPRSVDLGEEV